MAMDPTMTLIPVIQRSMVCEGVAAEKTVLHVQGFVLRRRIVARLVHFIQRPVERTAEKSLTVEVSNY